MAIDSRRKRASIASLGIAFLGASVVPDGSFVQGDRQAIAHSYYGINASEDFVQIGGNSQIEAYAASCRLTIEQLIGGTSQLEAYTSSGGLTIDQIIGGSSQLAAFTASGGLTVGRTVIAVDIVTGVAYFYDIRLAAEQSRVLLAVEDNDINMTVN